ncbi:MAG: cation:proton antiporter [Candidatus Hydrogenedentes bacterium]|nr:cation:proton antiporter [Candidatus Hydrogenedentota bacterium]
MHHPDMLSQTAVLFGTALVAALCFRFLKAPSILGFLFTGILIGPHLLGIVSEEEVEVFAEFGLVLLLFIIGLELSPESFMQAGPRLLLLTAIQLAGTTLLAAGAMLVFQMPVLPAILLGMAISLSSTAIVLKTLSDRDEVGTPAGQISTGNLLLQDVYVIGLMLLLPFVTREEGASLSTSIVQAGLGFLAMGAAVAAVRYALPRALDGLGRYGGPELLTLFAVFMAFGGAAFAHAIDWPPALGACAAGLLLAQADLRHQLVAEITPFRDVFNALFFISLGMLVQLDYVAENALFVVAAVAGILVMKAAVTSFAIAISGWPLRVAIQGGIGLCTVSEFGYVLAREAHTADLMSAEAMDSLIPVIVGTMMAGALLLPVSGGLATSLTRLIGRSGAGASEADSGGEEGNSHVLIVGYGVNGRNLARVLHATHIPCSVLEMNRAFAREARDAGLHVVVGDGTRARILEEAGLGHARAVVIAVNDRIATRRMVAQVRVLRHDIPIVVRTEYIDELELLMRAGATTVIPADFEVSIKLFATVLTEFRVPDNIVQAQIASVRAGGYGVLRDDAAELPDRMRELMEVLRLTATKTFYLDEDSVAPGRTIAGLNLRAETGVTIIAVVRDGKPNTNPPADFTLQTGDVLVLVGSHAQLDAAYRCLSGPEVTDAENQDGPAF